MEYLRASSKRVQYEIGAFLRPRRPTGTLLRGCAWTPGSLERCFAVCLSHGLIVRLVPAGRMEASEVGSLNQILDQVCADHGLDGDAIKVKFKEVKPVVLLRVPHN